MRKRWWIFRIVDVICMLLPRRGGGGTLLVRIDGIGDMALFRPFLESYASVLGAASGRLTILGGKNWKSLAPDIFDGYTVISIDENRFEKHFFYRLRTCLRLRRSNYDTAVCSNYFRKTMVHDSLILASGANTRIVACAHRSPKTRREFDWYEARMTRVVPTGEHPTHESVRHQVFLEAVAGHRLPTPDPTLPHLAREAAAVADGKPYAVLNFGSNEPGRNWPLSHYLSLAERLLAEGICVVFVGGANESVAKPRIASELTGPNVIDLIGEISLSRLLGVLRDAAVVVSNETGPGHLAILMGAPTVMIYGGGHAGSFMPYPPPYRPKNADFVNLGTDCYHCLWQCPKRPDPQAAFPCIADIAVDQVWRDVKRRLPTPA